MRLMPLCAAALLLMPAPTLAQEATAEAATARAAEAQVEARARDIVEAIRGTAPYDQVFSPQFVAQVPQAQFFALRDQITAQFGALVGLEQVTPVGASAATLRIRFERGMAAGSFRIADAPPHRVTEFLLTGVTPLGDSAAALLGDIEALPGTTSLLVAPLDGGTPLLAHNADRPLALGSTFKLYVLSALARSIAAGEHRWDEVVQLDRRSYPSGMTQDWPRGAPVTLHTLATLMISISDNTATDRLIELLGRDAIEAEVALAGHADPAAMQPLMTTRELFVLKSSGAEAIARYRAADSAGRLAQLEALGTVERGADEVIAAFTGGPNAIDVEWLASANDVAAVLRRLRGLEDRTALEILAVSPSVPAAARGDWTYAGYKGGSEPGVLNLTWLLQDRGGEWWVATMGWNDPAAEVDLNRAQALALRALALAAAAE